MYKRQDDDICQDLDTGLEARDTLLGFLMDNFRLTTEVWKLLDDRLSLCAEKEELYEKYPRDFVDFMANQCSSEGWFDYTLFEGEDDADYDGFIKMYHDIRLKLDKEENENFEREMRDLAGFDIYHPYMDIERVRYYRQKGRYGEAVETARPLVERYPEDTWILFMAAEALWDFNEKEEAFGLYASILEKEPAHFTARLRSAQYHMAVSYTHLDVYKRQEENGRYYARRYDEEAGAYVTDYDKKLEKWQLPCYANGSGADHMARVHNIETVSYTHLDVYKRQEQ